MNELKKAIERVLGDASIEAEELSYPNPQMDVSMEAVEHLREVYNAVKERS